MIWHLSVKAFLMSGRDQVPLGDFRSQVRVQSLFQHLLMEAAKRKVLELTGVDTPIELTPRMEATCLIQVQTLLPFSRSCLTESWTQSPMIREGNTSTPASSPPSANGKTVKGPRSPRQPSKSPRKGKRS